MQSHPFLDHTLGSAVDWLIKDQSPEGFWVGMVESNSAIEAEWLIAAHILGIRLPNEEGIIQTLRNRQRPDGSWDIFPGAPGGDINSTVEVYAALRARGIQPDDAVLERARAWILSHGGLRDVRVFTRYWLAMIGVWPWNGTPNLPPEVMLLPNWFPFSIYNFAQWARATMVPLAILSARRPIWKLPDGSRLEELFPEGIESFDFYLPVKTPRAFSLEALFLQIDKILHKIQTWKILPLREFSVKIALEWMLKHQDADGCWGGIQPPWIYGLLALRNEGYAASHPVITAGLNALSSHWSYERNGTWHLQASESPVWDTLFSLFALHEAGCVVSDSEPMFRGVEWVLEHQVREPGDWCVKVRGVAPGGWAFERANIHYPDVDDTALALLVLAKIWGGSPPELQDRIKEAIQLGVDWTFAMQCSNGGWAAFDRDNDKAIISKIPFCNYGEALDPPSVDVTAHVLEALGALGYTRDDPHVAKALMFIRSEQEADGSWFGRWGVNYVYGTGAVLPGLRAIGEDMHQAYIQRALSWLQERQNGDGGWGESCTSYMVHDDKGRGPSTPSQTAWGMIGLLSVDNLADDQTSAVENASRYLCDTQKQEGTWDEDRYTATGFPGYGSGSRGLLSDPEFTRGFQQGPELSRGFMLSFNLYRHYFPMIALSRVRGRVSQINTRPQSTNLRLAS